MQLSVIFTTYNSPLWLEKVLWGYQYQQFKNFEVIIADDGSTAETGDAIKKMQQQVDYPIRHIWHEDKGFCKCRILNKAIVASASDYLVFSDADCIPRKDFLQAHHDHKEKNHFLSGGAIRLPMNLSEMINKEKPALVLSMTANGSDGTIFVSSGGQYAKTAETAPASVVLSSDDYLRIQRLVESGVPVTLDVEVKGK